MIELRKWLGIARGGSNTYWLRRRWLTAAIELTPSDSCLVLLMVELTRTGFGDGGSRRRLNCDSIRRQLGIARGGGHVLASAMVTMDTTVPWFSAYSLVVKKYFIRWMRECPRTQFDNG
ncbi:unnamed protein product [Macrosiphum euphorbiae]|uniref:Uncharacterized protein n=1 Tax=Macrosiphum euphorbiae TaxID=13131 RepID=A0AAV0XMZ8_9HEMI|nr:unnamed protein product [Macrosiphum euphorbiae]